MTRRKPSNDFANGKTHSKGRTNQRGRREKRVTRGIRTISYNHPCFLSFSSSLSLSLFLFLPSGLSFSSRFILTLSISLRTSRVSLFNDCETTDRHLLRREWISNEPVMCFLLHTYVLIDATTDVFFDTERTRNGRAFRRRALGFGYI